MMKLPSLLTRLVPTLAITLAVLAALGIGLATLAVVITTVIAGVILSEYAQPWLTNLFGRLFAMGRVFDVTYEAVLVSKEKDIGKLRRGIAQVEGDLPGWLAMENIQVTSTKQDENGVVFEGKMLGGYGVTGGITLDSASRSQARVVITLTARSVPYRRLIDVLDTLFLAAIGGNRDIRGLLFDHGITGVVKGRVVITTRARPALLDYMPRGFGGITLTKSFGVKEYRITMSYSADTHTGYLVIEGPWGHVEEIARELLSLYT